MDFRRVAGVVAIVAGILPVIYGSIRSKLLGFGFIASGLYLTMRVGARGAPTGEAPRPRSPIAPVQVLDADTIASMRGPVNACPRVRVLGNSRRERG